MNNLLQLVKVNLIETLDYRKFKENKSKGLPFIIFIGIMGLLFLAISTIYNLAISTMFYAYDINLVHSTVMMSSFASILCFSTSVFSLKSIYIGKDYDMLAAMPIKKRTIVLSKIINLYIVELLYSLVILLPNLVINLLLSKDIAFIFIILPAIFLTPAIPMLISAIISLFITLIADRFKLGNLINFIFYVILFVAIFFFSFTMNTSGSDDQFAQNMYDASSVMIWINPSNYLLLGTENNILFIFLYIALNVALIFIVSSFIALFYDKIHNLTSQISTDTKYVRKKLVRKGELKTLLWLESKRFFSSKIYFINSISSSICAIIMTGFTAYMFSPFSKIEDVSQTLPYVREYAFLGYLLIVFGIGIATPAASSISMEGSKFWMTKSYPIDYKNLMKAKMLLSTIVSMVGSLISSIVVIVLIQPDIFASIMLVLISMAYSFLISVISLRINLQFPKLKWKTEQEVAKNGASIVVSMFLDWGIMIALAAISISLVFVNTYLSGIVTLLVILGASYLFYKDILYVCDRKIASIEDF